MGRPRLLRRLAATPRRPARRGPTRHTSIRSSDAEGWGTLARRYRRLGSRHGQRRRLAARTLVEHRLAGWEVSTATLESAYPWQVASTAGRRDATGIAVGPSPTGGTFTFDPWTEYRAGRLTNPNLLVLGEIGSGKSALVKTLVWRGLEFGRGALIVDPKGEYRPLAEAAGIEPIRLAPGAGAILNPLDPGVAGTQLSQQALFHRNTATVRALLEATLTRPCRQLEMVLLSAALARVSGLDHPPTSDGLPGQVATLPQLADALADPPASVAKAARMDPERVIDESREIALALARLVSDHGDLAGMFNGPTSIDADPTAPLTVVDIATIYSSHRALLPLVMICTAAWLQLAVDTTPRGRWQVNDEAWALLADDASARWMQANVKLSRQLSLSVINVLHRLSDTAAAGADGSATRAVAAGVVSDSGTRVIYRQPDTEADLLATTLGLNRRQVAMTGMLGRGRGLWLTGSQHRHASLVDHLLSDIEADLVDTDHAMNADPRKLTNDEGPQQLDDDKARP